MALSDTCSDMLVNWLPKTKQNQKPKFKKPQFVVFADFYGINTPIVADFRLPVFCH